MTDYKRMISYMYQYENGVKKNNVGYARIEAKNGQYKITLHMQLLGQSDSVFPTYLIHRGEEYPDLIYIGDSLLKNQLIDSKFTADETNIMVSGYRLPDMGGLLIFLNNDIFFASIWDDRPIVANELLEAMKPGKKSSAGSHRQGRAAATQISATDTPDVPEGMPEAMNLEEELKIPRYKLPRGWKTIEMFQIPVMKEEISQQDIIRTVKAGQDFQNMQKTETKTIPSDMEVPEIIQPELKEALQVNRAGDINEAAFNKAAFNEAAFNKATFNEEVFNEEVVSEAIVSEAVIREAGEHERAIREEIIKAEDYNDEEDPENNREAKYFFDNYPRIYPFEDNEVLLCVKIEPKDIGYLPKDTWALCSNSFLLHGFYCYHHLIFAKLKDKDDGFILGVPGIYHSREQFMAKMFGFNHFKSIRKRELRQGDFGYWYLQVNIQL